MSDTPAFDRSQLLHTAQPAAPRQAKAGERVWTLTKGSRRVDCELRYQGDAYGWECQFLTDGELASARRMGSRPEALSEADRERRRLVGQGWVVGNDTAG